MMESEAQRRTIAALEAQAREMQRQLREADGWRRELGRLRGQAVTESDARRTIEAQKAEIAELRRAGEHQHRRLEKRAELWQKQEELLGKQLGKLEGETEKVLTLEVINGKLGQQVGAVKEELMDAKRRMRQLEAATTEGRPGGEEQATRQRQQQQQRGEMEDLRRDVDRLRKQRDAAEEERNNARERVKWLTAELQREREKPKGVESQRKADLQQAQQKAATAVVEEQRAWKKQGELSRQLMQEREDRSAAEAKAAEEKGALMARIPAVSRGAARSAEQSAQPAGMMVDVEVAAITDELLRGPKTCLRLVYDEPNHRRAANKKRRQKLEVGSGAVVEADHFAAGVARAAAKRVEATIEDTTTELQRVQEDAKMGLAAEGEQVRALKRVVARGVTSMRHVAFTADAQQRSEKRANRALAERASRDERYKHQRLPSQNAPGPDRGAKRQRNTRLGPSHAKQKRKAKSQRK